MLILYWLGAAVVSYLTVRVFYELFISSLRNIPGPLLARLTRAWYLAAVWRGDFEKTNIDLHRKYGKIVRIAPNQFSIDDPEAMKVIMGYGSHFRKSDWYQGWASPGPRTTIFTEQDIKIHNENRRKIQNFYSMSSLVSYEPYVDECGHVLASCLRDKAESGVVVDMGQWLQYYAFDVISMITSSKPLGFLQSGTDVSGLIRTLDLHMMYGTLIGIYSELHRYAYPILNKLSTGREYLIRFSQAQIDERKAAFSAGKSEGTSMDLITKMFHSETEKETFTPYTILERVMGNVVAGSDTTATSLDAILYSLIVNPTCLRKLRDELKAHHIKIPASYQNVRELPYLQAVIKEGLRIYPAVALPMWRVVPKGGSVVAGQFLPEGAIVGINSWVAHRNTSVFGPDADIFRPERWLESSTDGLSAMDKYFLAFGAGSRTCLGANISRLEMSKVLPTLVNDFDFKLVDENTGMKRINYWFQKPTNFHCWVARRQA